MFHALWCQIIALTIILSQVQSYFTVRSDIRLYKPIHNKVINYSEKYNRRIRSRFESIQLNSNFNTEITNTTAVDNKLKHIIPIVIVAAASTLYLISKDSISQIDVNNIVEQVTSKIQELGPYGYLYFSVVISSHFISLFSTHCSYECSRIVIMYLYMYSGICMCRNLSNPIGSFNCFLRLSVWTYSRNSNRTNKCHNCCFNKFFHR